jgi:transketolase N-terminal domain/subunit
MNQSLIIQLRIAVIMTTIENENRLNSGPDTLILSWGHYSELDYHVLSNCSGVEAAEVGLRWYTWGN